jgi:hypothetical protein
MTRDTRRPWPLFASIALFLGSIVVSAPIWGQDTSTSSRLPNGEATVRTQVQSGVVVYVSGNNLVVKADDGQVRDFTVPDSTTFNVDGKDLTVHDLTPGMRLTRTTTTTSTPELVRKVRTITGKVWFVSPPSTLILSFPDGRPNKQYNVPSGTTFDVNGQKTDLFGLKKGMEVSATVITESPEIVQNTSHTISGTAPPPPPPPPTPPIVGVLLIERVAPTPAPAPAPAPKEMAQATLPKTGSPLPLIGLMGVMFLAASLGIRRVIR